MTIESQTSFNECIQNSSGPFIHFVPTERATTIPVQDTGNGDAKNFPVEGRLNTKEEVLTSMARALSFPDYFGENWDAFDECINDLSWLSVQAYVLLFKNGNDLLNLPRKDWDALFGVLTEAAESWRSKGNPFHLVLIGGDPLGQRLKALVDKEICFH